jgi:hypothetical protein
MLIWILIALGILIVVAYPAFGHRVALPLVVLWVVIALLGWGTGIGVRR